MQSTLLPGSITKELDRLVRRCVWGGSEDQRKMHLVKWEVLCKLKEKDSIDLRHDVEMNKALLEKLSWRLLKDLNTLWIKTILTKYGRGRNGLELFEHKNGASHIWRGIVYSFQALKGMRWRLGNGRKIKF